MKLYKSKLSDSILSSCKKFWNEIMLESIYWYKLTWNEYKNLAINYSIKLINNWIKSWDSVVIFISDLTKFSYIALAVILVWAKLVIIEPDMWDQVFEEKLKLIKPDLVIIDFFLYYLLKIPFLNKSSKIKKYNSLLKYSKSIFIEWKNKFKDVDYNKINYFNQNRGDEVLVVFTWWTTWTPKWVVHTLDSLEIMFSRITEIIWNKTNIFYADLPHFILIWISLWSKVIIWKNDLEDKKFLRILEKYKVDTTFSPPYRYLSALNFKKNITSTVKHICLWSAPIYKSFLEKLYNNLWEETRVTCIYWMTEMLPVSYVDWKDKLIKRIDWDLLWKVFSDIKISILEDHELELSGNWLFKKYLGWDDILKHKTWDLVEFKDWNLIMKWRKKDMILRKDYNIYPSLYESIINWIPWIIESALVWVWDKNLEDEKVILFLEWNNLEKKDIFKKLKSWNFSIDNFALPDEIIFCKIPRKWRQNKIDKNYLRDNYKKIWK